MKERSPIRYWRARSRRIPRRLWVTGWRQRLIKHERAKVKALEGWRIV